MTKVAILSFLILLAAGCGKNNNNDPSNAASAPGSNLVVPSYFAAYSVCPAGRVPFLRPHSRRIRCVPLSVLQRYGQPLWQENYQWSESQTGAGPGQMCDANEASSCGMFPNSVCQPIDDSGSGYCR